MKLAIGNDHVAVEMKREIKAYLEEKGIEVLDVGTNSTERFHYPISGYRVAKLVAAGDIDLLVRALSMGKLHHAMMGTAAVAIGTAAAIPGTLVNLAAGGGERSAVRFGHPSGTLRVGAEASQANGEWTVTKAIMSRSARILMEGWVRVPGDAF